VPVPLDAQALGTLKGLGLESYYGDDLGAALRDVLFSWWEKKHLG
jgi:hypothetical protein